MVPFFGAEILFEIGCGSIFFWGGGEIMFEIGCGSILLGEIIFEIGCGSNFGGDRPLGVVLKGNQQETQHFGPPEQGRPILFPARRKPAESAGRRVHENPGESCCWINQGCPISPLFKANRPCDLLVLPFWFIF